MSSTASLDGSYEDSLPGEDQVFADKDRPLKWIEKFETEMMDFSDSDCTEPKHIVKAFLELELDRESRILDVLAGTGLVAELLRPHGYVNIDAIDGRKDMLTLSNKKQLYKNFYVSLLGCQYTAPIQSDIYDVLIASGAFAPGRLHSDAFCDLLRITKPGGIIMWSMRTDYGPISPRFANFDAHIEDLVTNGVWKHYVPRKTIKPYVHGSEGYVYTMQRI
ncbi:hypothetical protein OUZ56_029264 [Daphnia magna]|uniref:Methyltransferase type 11 domain-containing protein n=1 Tax=Daphnia magna TaxID=35525 RepID=A0ABR0B6A5_9CRUS|nr:hypothetical protein OUZ56_029264 [Daphnia magna]